MHTAEYEWQQDRPVSFVRNKKRWGSDKENYKRILRKYNMQKKENLHQVIKELKQKVLAKTQ